jgi:uncharacterized protein YoxC
MPVQLQTLRGDVPYTIEKQIQDIVRGVNTLEAQVNRQLAAIDPAQIAGLQRSVDTLTARLDALSQRVQALEP